MKTILITGCSTGIGHAAAELFAEKGWTVYAGSRNPEALKFKNSSIRSVKIDVNDDTSINRCFDEFRSKNIMLDCVVNNAGYGLLLPFEDTSPEEIENLFRVNVFGLMAVSRRAAGMMRERNSGLPPGARSAKGGTIINISSVLGTIGIPWYAAYSATKWAVEGFSESLAHELRRFNVHVKIVEPGGTKTEFHNTAYVSTPVSEPYRELFERKRASRGSKGDYDTAESIAALIWQAANDDSWTLRYSAKQAKSTLFWQRILGRDGLWRKLNKN